MNLINTHFRYLIEIGLVYMTIYPLQSQDTLIPFDHAKLKIAAIQWMDAQPERATAVLEQWSKYYQENKQTDLQELSLVFLSQMLLASNRNDEGHQILNKILHGNNPYAKAMANKVLASEEFRNGRFFGSTVKIRAAMELAKSIPDEELLAELQEDLAQVFDKISKPEKAIQFYNRSLLLFTKLDKKAAMQKNALALGRIYLGLGKLDSAFIFIQRSLDIAIQEKLMSELFEARMELGNYFYLSNDFANLHSIIEDYASITNRPRGDFAQVKYHVLKGKYAMAMISESEATYEFNKAESFSHQGFTPFLDYYIKSNLADAYYRKGNVAKAYELVSYLNHNSNSYASKENQKLAEQVSQDSEIGIRDREIDYLKIANQLNEEKLKRELLRRQIMKRENELKDYAFRQEQLLMNASLREKELQSKQLENEKSLNQSLLRENDLRQATIRDERNFQTVLWAGIILLLIFGFVIYYLFRKQREKNAIILNQTKDLEFVNKEVHHRVKNNLQVISSLLDLQSQFTQDKNYENLLKESKHRVQSMAFIHQNLYESAGMNMVDMPNYIQHLMDHLVTAYQKYDEQITIDVNVDPIQLHMDTVVSIGMIINELVTNSMKYAFSMIKRGAIMVSLKDVGSNLRLVVEDNGMGLPEQFNFQTSQSFGYKMVRAFVQKLKGSISIDRDKGTRVCIDFNKR